ncbi:hypothetical protein ACE1CI_01025 [Aerosakkonemataceae cyanobacterium BLCC-F50]|uniref:Outer membrane protein beta-barrel domain-containing protein n=1 Tax=Floridaenema flaviceps BLCC-F50 TaxID=3153642 RepID=A0ABV4XIG7_9CYAN
MNNLFLQRAIFLLSLTAMAGGIGNLPAQAETPKVKMLGNSEWLVAQSNQQNLGETSSSNLGKLDQSNIVSAIDSAEQQLKNSSSDEKSSPVPGTTLTSAANLLGQTVTNSNSRTSTATTENTRTSNSRTKKGTQVAQFEIEPGRETRSGSSYVGAGGNIGLTGESGIGENGFALFSKIGLTRALSVRPMVVFAGDTDFIIPITYDFAIAAEPFQRINLAPFVGIGAIITTYRERNAGLALTGGVDIPITANLTAVGSVTLGFVDTTSVGILLGVGYNFGQGFRF